MSKTTTRREQWKAILAKCGGRGTTKDCALMAIRMNMFPELRGKAEIKALQADARKNFNLFDDDGSPTAIAFQEIILNDEGEETTVDTWIQSDFCQQEEWEFCLQARMQGQKNDAKKTRKILNWGLRQWPKTAKHAFTRIQNQFGFVLDDVAGDDDEEEPSVA